MCTLTCSSGFGIVGRGFQRAGFSSARLTYTSENDKEPFRLFEISAGIGVDLRVGGGAAWRSAPRAGVQGRSPRGRRSRFGRVSGEFEGGSISAWAEEPDGGIDCEPVCGVDLRCRRRSPCLGADGVVYHGSISAWAEEPAMFLPAPDHGRVDLRVGGGAWRWDDGRPDEAGRSPRGRRSQRDLGRRLAA